jgi:ATP-dependent exoDNAse (exonuclease V) beta subunit
MAAAGEGHFPPAVAPIPADHAARRAFSFSRLTGQLKKVSGTFTDPLSHPSQEVLVDPRGFGSLVHEVLARTDFHNKGDIAGWCELLAPQHVLLNSDQAANTAREMIAHFVASPTGRQLAESAAMHREVEFLLAWPPGETNGDGAHVRGYIDCLYQDAQGDWRLVDYKTDDVVPADVPRVAKRYEMQLYVYAIAAERALGQPPVELTLHFLRPGAEHVFPWNDTARRRAIDLVNESIRNLTQKRA